MKKNLLIAALAIFGCATGFAQETGTQKKDIDATADTWVRMNNTTDKNEAKPTLEIWTGYNADNEVTADFVGLMSFTIPDDIKGGITKATLVLFADCVKGDGVLDIHPFKTEFEENEYYGTYADAIAEARKTTLYSQKLNGKSGSSVTDVKADDETYNKLESWKNEYDMTEYVKSLSDNYVGFLFTHDAGEINNNGRCVKIYTKEATDVKRKGTDEVIFKGSDLVPKLIVEYTTATGINEVETVEPVAKGKEGIYTLSGVRVAKADQPGIYIINGKKVMVGRK